jgi:hypothetical protein
MTKVWLREEKGRTGSEGGYMDTLLAEVVEQLHDYAEAAAQDADTFVGLERELLDRIRAELVRSFKNGVMRGREERHGRQAGELNRLPRR